MARSTAIRLFFLFLSASTALAGLLPATETAAVLKVVPRAQATFVTMYGLYDDTSYSGPRASGKPRLAPVGEVYLAMVSSSMANAPSPTAMAAMNPAETLPPLGPGIVLLPPSPTAAAFVPPTETQSSQTAAPTGVMAPGPSSRVILLGSVIGGIFLLTLLIFFVLNPKVSGQAGNFLRFTKRVAKRRTKGLDGSTPGGTEAAWVSVTGAARNPDDTRADSESPSSSPEKVREKEKVQLETPAVPPFSRFSMYSSDGLSVPPSPRPDSLTPSECVSITDTIATEIDVRPSGTNAAANTSPPRPPRPPTADSPALSDSVYLACSDQPYVIVVPKRFSTMPDAPETPPPSTRKQLTPSEFITLNGAGTMAADTRLGAGPTASEPKAEKDRCVSFQPDPKRESFHARTKSTPILGFMLRRTKTASSSMFSFNDVRSFDTMSVGCTTSDSEMDHSAMTEKLLRHRRSRSASGWAYPERDQQKTKKFFSMDAPSLLR